MEGRGGPQSQCPWELEAVQGARPQGRSRTRPTGEKLCGHRGQGRAVLSRLASGGCGLRILHPVPARNLPAHPTFCGLTLQGSAYVWHQAFPEPSTLVGWSSPGSPQPPEPPGLSIHLSVPGCLPGSFTSHREQAGTSLATVGPAPDPTGYRNRCVDA